MILLGQLLAAAGLAVLALLIAAQIVPALATVPPVLWVAATAAVVGIIGCAIWQAGLNRKGGR